jgi:hypothetical protein
MTRNAITEKYLATISRPIRMPENKDLNLFYQGRFLSRPLFLEHAEMTQLHADIENLRSALISLPARLFGGDLAAFAREVGTPEVQVSAILRSRSDPPTRLSRADLYADGSRFRVLEYNMGSTLGGLDIVDMYRGMLTDPELAGFVEGHRLTCIDSLAEHVRTICAETGVEHGSRPVIALADWPASYQTLAPYIRAVANRWQQLGLDAHACHVGELTARDGRVWLGDRPVDVVNRLFMLEDLLESPDAPAVMDPVLDAAQRGEVVIFTPMDTELYGCKGALALLSDEANRHLFSPAEAASLNRVLPWTRMARSGPVTLEGGERVDLFDYAIEHQRDLALKPSMGHGGHGVVLGWLEQTSPQEWRRHVAGAMGGPWVLQRRVQPVPELFWTDDGELAPWIVTWGFFTVTSGTAGIFIRAIPDGSDCGVVNVDSGAHSGFCLWTDGDSARPQGDLTIG